MYTFLKAKFHCSPFCIVTPEMIIIRNSKALSYRTGALLFWYESPPGEFGSESIKGKHKQMEFFSIYLNTELWAQALGTRQ